MVGLGHIAGLLRGFRRGIETKEAEELGFTSLGSGFTSWFKRD